MRFLMVTETMRVDPSAFPIDSKENSLRNDAVVLAVAEVGYNEKGIPSVAESMQESGLILSRTQYALPLRRRKISSKQ